MSDPGFPSMSDNTWLSGRTPYELGWISGLYKVANNSIDSIYGNYDEFQLHEDDILDLDTLNVDAFVQDSVGPIIYLSVWAAVGIIFTIVGIVWCLCNKCVCCCRSGFKDREEKGGSSICRIVLPVVMALLLLAFLLVILHCFGANEKTRETVKSIKPDLDAAINDATKYVKTVQGQLSFVFVAKYAELDTNIEGILTACAPCDVDIGIGATISFKVREAMGKTNDELQTSNRDLNAGITDVDQTIKDVKAELDDNFEDAIDNANIGLYWGLMLFNVLYCVVFSLALIGTVLAAFGVQRGMKVLGYLLLRLGIALMFGMSIFVVAFMLVTFVAGGITQEIICPAIRSLENGGPPSIPTTTVAPISPSTTAPPTEFKMPNFPSILKACKADYSAYDAFNLGSAYDIGRLGTLVGQQIDPIIKQLEGLAQVPPIPEALDNVRKIRDAINVYTNYAMNTVKTDVGRCAPAYNIIDATLDLFCYKVAAPVTSYWWILQFVLPLYALMIITIILFERHNF